MKSSSEKYVIGNVMFGSILHCITFVLILLYLYIFSHIHTRFLHPLTFSYIYAQTFYSVNV